MNSQWEFLPLTHQVLLQESMQSEQLGKPLINTNVMEMQTTSGEEESVFIQRYNQVIYCYNRNVQEGQPIMQVMVGNSFIYKISKTLSKPISSFLLILILLFIPVLNIFCLSCFFVYLFYLKRENKKHQRNIERVKDPFEKFFFMPQLCEQMGKHHATLNLQQDQLQGFTFNEALRQKLSDKVKEKHSKKDDEKLSVLIYDQYFYDSFYLYRKQFFKTIMWTAGGGICLAFSILFYASIFDLL